MRASRFKKLQAGSLSFHNGYKYFFVQILFSYAVRMTTISENPEDSCAQVLYVIFLLEDFATFITNSNPECPRITSLVDPANTQFQNSDVDLRKQAYGCSGDLEILDRPNYDCCKC